jgi:hypothetical protein
MDIHLQQMYRSEIIDLRSLKIFFEQQEWLNVLSTLDLFKTPYYTIKNKSGQKLSMIRYSMYLRR